MSIDGLMPPNSVNMTGMIREFSAYEVFARHKVSMRVNPLISPRL